MRGNEDSWPRLGSCELPQAETTRQPGSHRLAGATVRCSVAAMPKSRSAPAKAGLALSATTTARLRRRTARGFGLLLITAFAWGLNWPLMKYLLSEVPPF